MADKITDLEVKEMFQVWDTDGSGDIDLYEFQNAAAALGVLLSNAKAQEMFDSIDADKSGKLEYNEFNNWIKKAVSDGVGENEDSPELYALKGKLMAAYGYQLASYYTDQVEVTVPPEEKVKQAQQSKPVKTELKVLIGQAALSSDGVANDDSTSLHVSLRDPSFASDVRGAVGIEKGVAVQLVLGIKDGADGEEVSKLTGRLSSLLELGGGKISNVAVDKIAEGKEIAIKFSVPPSAKVDKMTGLASVFSGSVQVAVDVNVWPKVSPASVAAKDLSASVSVSATIPSELIDMLKAMVAMKKQKAAPASSAPNAKSKKDPTALLPLLTALRVASLEFKYDDITELAAIAGDNSKFAQFLNNGAWGFLKSKLDENKALLDAGVLPPAVKPTLQALAALSTGFKRLDVSPADGLAVGVDFTNFDVFSLLADI
mmetsp:Transcript_18649/g.32313  ORF Transcript_18649/g.32313 Transcript_18649/m.32313 type:complete len:430 (+) Transcript_18649:43-1332(+)